MLPEVHRLNRAADFSRAVRNGRRQSRGRVVVHVFDDAAATVRCGGPRFGLIVSKAVGNSVIRHRVSRRLRHICSELVPEIGTSVDVVIRVLPGAGELGSAALRADLRGALRRKARQSPVHEPTRGVNAG